MKTQITNTVTRTLKLNKCLLCGKKWLKRVSNPVQCPRCHRTDWNRERKDEQ